MEVTLKNGSLVSVTDQINLAHGSATVTLENSTITMPTLTLGSGNGSDSFDVVFNLTLTR